MNPFRSQSTSDQLADHLRKEILSGRLHGAMPGIQQIVKNVFGDAETAGGVFAVDDDKINIMGFDEAGQPVDHGMPSGFADNIPQKQATHAGLPLFVESPVGFLMPCSAVYAD